MNIAPCRSKCSKPAQRYCGGSSTAQRLMLPIFLKPADGRVAGLSRACGKPAISATRDRGSAISCCAASAPARCDDDKVLAQTRFRLEPHILEPTGFAAISLVLVLLREHRRERRSADPLDGGRPRRVILRQLHGTMVGNARDIAPAASRPKSPWSRHRVNEG
jgi:hypothetical protein